MKRLHVHVAVDELIEMRAHLQTLATAVAQTIFDCFPARVITASGSYYY